MFPKISPIIPERRPGIFEHPDWLYELKHDGFRALAYIDQGRCRLISRKGNEMKRFEDLSAAIRRALKVKTAVLDGEIVALDESGMPAFYHLMRRKCHAVYYACHCRKERSGIHARSGFRTGEYPRRILCHCGRICADFRKGVDIWPLIAVRALLMEEHGDGGRVAFSAVINTFGEAAIWIGQVYCFSPACVCAIR
jgi:ATP dependent DNA ligase domain